MNLLFFIALEIMHIISEFAKGKKNMIIKGGAILGKLLLTLGLKQFFILT